jgi:hypothetical protein
MIKAKKEQPEFELQKQVCQYLRLQYPNVLFMTDTIAAVKLTIPQGVRNKSVQKEGFKCPDLLVFEKRENYGGLFLELKVETPFKKDGGLKASQNDHLKLQLETLKGLRKKGYFAEFAWGFEMCK